MKSREALEGVLEEYSGTLLFISHDRHLVSLLARQLLIIENQKAIMFDGKFHEWIEKREILFSNTMRIKDLKIRQSPKGRRKPKSATAGKFKNDSVDLAEEISELEVYLQKVERDLQKASKIGDMAGVVRFGERYKRIE